MRTITFNKQKMSICQFCKKNKVPIAKWNLRCAECQKEEIEKIKSEVVVGQRKPAARVVDEDGHEVYVDKFGVPVDNPGYDLENDPRGWNYTGTAKKQKTII